MNTPTDPKTLQPAVMVDSDHPAVIEFAREHAHGSDDRERAVALFYAVRDGFRYDPYRIDLSVQGMKGSTVLSNGFGWCVPKAALLAAACRAAGIPARVGYADVRNHLSTERLRQNMGSDLFVWHGYVDIGLAGQWLKATPAFNIELCDRFGLLPDPTKNLFAVTALKLEAERLGIRKIDAGAEGGRLEFSSETKIDPMRLIKLIQTQPRRYKLEGGDRLKFMLKSEDATQRLQVVHEVLQALQS